MRDEFLITRQGKQYVLFSGLLDEAHTRGLRSIDTELVQIPNEENGQVAIVKATVTMEDDRAFSGIGDASPRNVSRNIAPHLIRMAETRAKARALRDAVNVGATALEELGGEEGEDAPPAHQYSPGKSPAGLPAGQAGNTGRTGRDHPVVRAVEDLVPQQTQEDARAEESQVQLLRTLATELRGEDGVSRLEGRIGKPLAELSRNEVKEWIERLTPAGSR